MAIPVAAMTVQPKRSLVEAVWHGIGEGWHWLDANSGAVQALCVVLSAVAAFWVIYQASLLSRREKTIEMIKDTLLDEDGTGPYTAFNNALDKIKDRIQSLDDKSENDKPIIDLIDQQLNVYELISLGIRQKVFEEKFYWLWFRSQLLRDYDTLRPYINRLRREISPTIASEFRWLSIRWKRRTSPNLYPSRVKMAFWAFSGKRQRLLLALEYDDPLKEDEATEARLAAIKKRYLGRW
jgi:hypothetical protein